MYCEFFGLTRRTFAAIPVLRLSSQKVLGQ